MYTKEFEIRWNDLDGNRHLANSAYTNFMSHTRMSFLLDLGVDQKFMVTHQMGPVAFYEHMYYFKEAFFEQRITVTITVMGMSEDGTFFEFHHNFYDANGVHLAYCEMMGGWMNLKERKLSRLPETLLSSFQAIEKPKGFRVLTKADTRKFAKAPKNLR